MSSVIGIIPARMASSRFPGKPLAPIAGKPMLQWVFDGAKTYPFDRLVVATCDMDIEAYCLANGIPSVVTSSQHIRALDRCAEAAKKLFAAPDDIVVCVQGDEPMVTAIEIADTVAACRSRSAVALLSVQIASSDLYDPDLVKVLQGRDGYLRTTTRRGDSCADTRIAGLFAFTGADIARFASLPPSQNEIAEDCDINRWLDSQLVCVQTLARRRPYLSVDRPTDIAKVERALAAAPSASPYEFAAGYLARSADVIAKLDIAKIAALIHLCDEKRTAGNTIFFCGNGGAAAIAQEFANDLGVGAGSFDPPFRVVCLNDNAAMFSAIANDEGYDRVFVRQLEMLMHPGDLVIAISSSGNSRNVIAAFEYARSRGAATVALTAMGGGIVQDMVDMALIAPTEIGEQGPSEDAHLATLHAVINWFKHQRKNSTC